MKQAMIFFTLFLFLGVCNAETKIVDAGGYYMAFYKGKYREIFRRPSQTWSYGFGLMSEDVAVFTYQALNMTVATAVVEFINLENGKTTDSYKVHNAGETSFHFNGSRGVYNDGEELKIIDFINSSVYVTALDGTLSKNIFAPFWIDSNTIGYGYFEKGEKKFGRIVAPPP